MEELQRLQTEEHERKGPISERNERLKNSADAEEQAKEWARYTACT